MAKRKTPQLVRVEKGLGITGVTVHLTVDELRALKEVNETIKDFVNGVEQLEAVTNLTNFIDKLTAEVTSPKDIYDRLFAAEAKEDTVNMADASMHEDIFNEDDAVAAHYARKAENEL